MSPPKSRHLLLTQSGEPLKARLRGKPLLKAVKQPPLQILL